MELNSSVQEKDNSSDVVILISEVKSVRSEFQKYSDFFFAKEDDHSDALNSIRDADRKNSIFFLCAIVLFLCVMGSISSVSPKDSAFSDFFLLEGVALAILFLVSIVLALECVLIAKNGSFIWIRVSMVISRSLIFGANIYIYFVFTMFQSTDGFSPFIVIVVVQSLFNLMEIYNWAIMTIQHYSITTLFTILELYSRPAGFTPLPITTPSSV